MKPSAALQLEAAFVEKECFSSLLGQRGKAERRAVDTSYLPPFREEHGDLRRTSCLKLELPVKMLDNFKL